MNKKASLLDQWDKKYLWHPFTQMRDWVREPIAVIEKGKGNYLYDTRGRKYLDGVSSLWCNVHGHQVPEIDRAIKAQLGKIAHSTFLGLSNVPAIELGKKLVEIAPKGLTRVFYSDSGSAAVEVAIKMAYQYWQLKGRKEKKGFIRLQNAYHGDTLGSVSVGGISLFHQIFGPLLFKTIPARSAEQIESILKKQHRKIGAIIVEPLMQGAAGMLTYPKGTLKKISQLAKRYEALLIVDEVATGFGRTGKMFACEHENVSPDFLCLAKGLTGGYLPLSATMATENVYNVFLGEYKEFKAFFHGHTYSANPLACAAAIASLDLFKKKRVLEKLQPKIKLLTRELEKVSTLKAVKEIRQVGMMVGIELQNYPLEQKRGARVCLEARKHGVMLRPLGNVIVLMPPLSITEAEIRKLCAAVSQSIVAVCCSPTARTCHGFL